MVTFKEMIGSSAGMLLNQLLANDSLRRLALRQAEQMAYESCMEDAYPVAVKEAEFIAKRNLLYAMNKALDKGLIAPNVRKQLLQNLGGRIMLQHNDARQKFIDTYKICPPGFLTISPTATCNLTYGLLRQQFHQRKSIAGLPYAGENYFRERGIMG